MFAQLNVSFDISTYYTSWPPPDQFFYHTVFGRITKLVGGPEMQFEGLHRCIDIFSCHNTNIDTCTWNRLDFIFKHMHLKCLSSPIFCNVLLFFSSMLIKIWRGKNLLLTGDSFSIAKRTSTDGAGFPGITMADI